MKNLLLILVILTSINFANATNINTPVEHREFQQYTQILEEQVDWAERVLDRYIEDKLGCSNVRFNLKINKAPGIFRKGQFELNLTAKCTHTFHNFQYSFYDGYDEDYTTLEVSFITNDRLVTQKFSSRNWY